LLGFRVIAKSNCVIAPSKGYITINSTLNALYNMVSRLDYLMCYS